MNKLIKKGSSIGTKILIKKIVDETYSRITNKVPPKKPEDVGTKFWDATIYLLIQSLIATFLQVLVKRLIHYIETH